MEMASESELGGLIVKSVVIRMPFSIDSVRRFGSVRRVGRGKEVPEEL